MAIVVTEDGRKAVLGAAVFTMFPGLRLGLFANDYTPVILSVTGDFVEPTFDNYARKLIVNFGGMIFTAGATARVQADPVIFTVGGLGGVDTIYGYFVVDSFNRCVWAERDPRGPIAMGPVGAKYTVIPRFEIGTLCP